MAQVGNAILGIGIFRVGVDLSPIEDSIKKVLCQREGVSSVIVNCYRSKIYIEYDPTRMTFEELRHLVKLTTRCDESELMILRER